MNSRSERWSNRSVILEVSYPDPCTDARDPGRDTAAGEQPGTGKTTIRGNAEDIIPGRLSTRESCIIESTQEARMGPIEITISYSVELVLPEGCRLCQAVHQPQMRILCSRLLNPVDDRSSRQLPKFTLHVSLSGMEICHSWDRARGT